MTCWKSNRMVVFCGQVASASGCFVSSSTLCDGQNFLSLCCGISAMYIWDGGWVAQGVFHPLTKERIGKENKSNTLG